MATNSPRTNTFRKKGENAKKAASTKSKGPKISLGGFKNSKFVLTLGIILMSAGIFLFIAFISYLLNGPADQSVVMNNDSEAIRESARESQNWLGFLGAQAGHWMIYRWFGVAAFLFPPFLFILGFRWTFKLSIISLTRYTSFALFFTFWLGLLTGYIVILVQGYSYWSFLSGGFGYELAKLSSDFLGWGTFILIGGALLIFVIFFFDIDKLDWFSLKNTGDDIPYEEDESEGSDDLAIKPSSKNEDPFALDDEEEIEDDGSSWTVKGNEGPIELSTEKTEEEDDLFNVPQVNLLDEIKEKKSEVVAEEKQFSVTKPVHEEKTAEEVENLDPYDPTLDLPRYKYPTLDLLNEYDLQKVTVTRQELEENKNKIVETLENFKIGIQEIKATIGPTVTLYEIVPEPGVKISKIKNLEDDIALSLAALGIRIIAPIPGKGTIGIEVPNKNRELVPARAVLGTEKFMRSDKDLPIALGKTISNEVFVVDLAKMPHLLMAGATGQGKSVGLNMILASLIYKKHPSQLKFVLVDPKKVELTLFNKIERHFLAKLPGSEEAIITDTKKVIYTLNSLCIEMDNRYNLLKDAGARNLKEYNAKFIARKLNPEKGHRFMPYIVLVIDELADLMMTAGKEIEGPIARLAQLARAIGIHLVVATQRPSVNVITGIIKANFPARLSFRVTSKIDSRTILDAGGADQLIGMGDMLLSQGSEMIRLQCAFLDTPEVDAICDWIGEQKGYSDAYLLPEFEGEESESGVGEVDLSDRDPLFDDAARLIVMHQQGSTSLIQRKLKLGYNRAGRIVDQLEAAGVVGPFEGSKAREVLIQDEASLEQLLNSL
ncbi:MAG TPA: DNA translocase FtsK [Algoriphagus sp.]|jgi:S-DNA-T family DNA segregation ATPase FtsK/SpoIIIE|uniref:DNA segregation ATPase FtsK/SpoIIIE, S-DNA-T family n=3 Tax=Algoriphagus TaxID=246875 RepID=A0A1I5EXL1_9BACT|nr:MULTISPECIES: DNA translocase FtsK [Algoriphagus]MAL12282.1 DNA translocase FtsK [Algoriphagus sp.]MAN88567.1 DNA translocase FtsK [Algoriphagus sp.]SFO16187.1 DNA segregation ATPase FtsK/SpoIIIE, S-DNA-T family [Algoriphagus ornithinivorans]HCD87970.1 DNA translocase FtsK [Algoriphagus sp.]HCH45971.1 DNA translocase FtsK [Algoriphagus sp.]|tara:strand:+ start:115 stop:2607 length:2493 start_codon:yes stop_codon:yes gene_type:complete